MERPRVLPTDDYEAGRGLLIRVGDYCVKVSIDSWTIMAFSADLRDVTPYLRLPKLRELDKLLTGRRYKPIRDMLGSAMPMVVRMIQTEIPRLLDKRRSKPEESVAVPDSEVERCVEKIKSNPTWMLELHRHFDLVIAEEYRNRMLAYVVCASSKLHPSEGVRPALELRGESGGGKSHTLDCVTKMFPNVEEFTSVTMKALRRSAKELGNLQHKILYVTEREALDRSEDLRELLTRGRLRVLSSEKTDKGVLTSTIHKFVGYPVFITTYVNPKMAPQMATRLLFSAVDMSEEHQRMVLMKQAELENQPELEEAYNRLCAVYREYFRRLGSYGVCVPMSYNLHKMWPTVKYRLPYRDFKKFIKLTKAITLLNQYHRPFYRHGDEYRLIALPVDVLMAVGLAWDVISATMLNLSPPEIQVYRKAMPLIMEKGYCELGEISKELGWRKGYVEMCANNLVENGLLEYGTHPDDRRRKVLVEGKVRIEQFDEAARNIVKELSKPELLENCLRAWWSVSALYKKTLDDEMVQFTSPDEAVEEYRKVSEAVWRDLLANPESPFYIGEYATQEVIDRFIRHRE